MFNHGCALMSFCLLKKLYDFPFIHRVVQLQSLYSEGHKKGISSNLLIKRCV